MKLLDILLNEGKQVGKIYHFTSIKSIVDICLIENSLIGRPFKHNNFSYGNSKDSYLYNQDDIKKHHNYYKDIIKKYELNYFTVSFTRDKFLNNIFRSVSSMECRMIFDGDKLSNKYQFMPYQFLSNIGRDREGIGDEQEELCLIKGSNNIKNINSYIQSIELLETHLSYYFNAFKLAEYFKSDLGYGDEFNLDNYMKDNNLKIRPFTQSDLICEFFRERLDIMNKEFGFEIKIVKK
jgi:hypothetical protein